MGHLIDAIKEGLGKLRSWRVEYVKSDANSATHMLAREAFSCVINRVWVEEIPNRIYDIVTKENGSWLIDFINKYYNFVQKNNNNNSLMSNRDDTLTSWCNMFLNWVNKTLLVVIWYTLTI